MGERNNTFGALRLLFAGLVIVSHSPEMIDGNRLREPLHAAFGVLTFGELAVDAFFLVSGYLIASSFANSSSISSYFLKRILRIYPAFLVCGILCVFVVAPLGGASLTALGFGDWAKIALRLLVLKPPEVDGALAGLPYAALNGAAWTIAYEFRCYVLAAIFGLLGLYRRRWTYLGLTAAALVGNMAMETHPSNAAPLPPGWLVFTLGTPIHSLRLTSAFMVGTCFWLFRDKIRYTWPAAAACASIAVALLSSPLLAETGLMVFGGYALFWAAFMVRWRPLLTLNAKNDISYGLYLYAWPIAALIIWYWREVPPVILGLLTFFSATVAGIASWFLIERPMLKLKDRNLRRRFQVLTARALPATSNPRTAAALLSNDETPPRTDR